MHPFKRVNSVYNHGNEHTEILQIIKSYNYLLFLQNTSQYVEHFSMRDISEQYLQIKR